MIKEKRWLEPSGTSSSVVTMTSLRNEKKGISRHKGILKYFTKEVDIPTEYEAKNDEDKMKIYEGNSKAWNFLIISLKDIFLG